MTATTTRIYYCTRFSHSERVPFIVEISALPPLGTMEVRAILERGRAPLGLRAAPFFIAHPIIRNALKYIGVQQTDRSKGTASDRDGNFCRANYSFAGLD